MRDYIGNYLTTISRNKEERISSLIEEARVGKEQLSVVATRLNTLVNGFDSAVMRKDAKDGRISSGNFIINLRDLTIRIRDLYSLSNAISLLLNSHASVLTSDIKAIEDEIIAMEKMAFNFSFLLSDNQAFDFAHLESFNDETGRDTSVTAYPDRIGRNFQENEFAFTRIDEGVLTLPQTIANSHGLFPRIIKSNVSAFVQSDSGINQVLAPNTSSGWIQRIATAGPVTSTITNIIDGGAQVLLEFTLSRPAPSSEIKLIPYADAPVEVVSVKRFDSEKDRKGVELVNSVTKLDRPLSLHFPISTVARFTVLLRQPVFDRVVGVEKVEETSYIKQVREINRKRVQTRFSSRRPFQIRKLERALQSKTLSVRGDTFHSASLPLTNARPDSGPLNPVVLRLNRQHDQDRTWRDSRAKYDGIMRRAINQRFRTSEKVIRGESNINLDIAGSTLASGETPQTQIMRSEQSISDSKFGYRYSIGLHYVGIGIEKPQFRGVYVSKSLPASSDIGEVRLKAAVDDYILKDTARTSKQLTSVEFSVSNSPDPSNESDWIPILPVGVESVVGERLSISANGISTFRFPAREGQLFILYKNGFPVADFTEIQGAPGEILGLRINPAIIGPNDVFTCDYYPVGDKTTVNFAPYGFSDVPLVSSFDSTGAGEGFTSTNEGNTVTLSNFPYIDYARITEDAYDPIVVSLDTGEVPTNLTDYVNGGVSPATLVDGYYYHHSGNTIRFNEAINTPFRIFYQYLQNNVRFRVVLRCNVQDLVSPKVDYVHVKAKTRKPNPKRL